MENTPRHCLEELLDEINRTLRLIENHKGPIKFTPELKADIKKLTAAASQLKQGAAECFEMIDVDMEEIKRETLNSDHLRSNDKQLIKCATDIETESRFMKLILEKAKDKRLENPNKSEMGDEKHKIKERKKMFKTIGGDQKWIPL